MIVALDENQKRVFIEDSLAKYDYYCPSCGAPLVQRKGEVRQHHFSHQPNCLCNDSWEREYDMSIWHYEWQCRFPKDNQEVVLTWGEIKHRADVLIGRTVIELQHSALSMEQFNNRNNFYISMGYKVIWIFDLIESFANKSLTCINKDNGKHFEWTRPKKIFNNFDVQSGQVELFFQISDKEEDCLVKVSDVSIIGFEEFETLESIGINEFMEYMNIVNGICECPYHEDITENATYKEFKEKYGINLNIQQERAVQTVEGANMLLAVPGSGKTTVLVVRLGYMIICKGITPNKVLAMTYTKAASIDMKKRFSSLFGSELGNKIQFKTINSIACKIIQSYAKQPFQQLDDSEKNSIIKRIYKEVNEEYPTESDCIETERAIGYIKNMMINDNEIAELDVSVPKISEIYKKYKETLRQRKVMDFDDQLTYAYQVLKKSPTTLLEFQNKYRYICVDEAQDTSKIQHKIIQMLACKNNIFMVGDEDQSIYGFRGAYPKALLNFKNEYRNPFVLNMENNYRSTEEIVMKAQKFVEKNKNRNEKCMIANRERGEVVERKPFPTRSAEYKYLLDIASKTKTKTKTAILYRDNDIAIPLIDLLLRNEIKFKALKRKLVFFTHKIVEDIKAFMKLAINPFDTESFMKIYYKCGYGFNKRTAEWTCKNSRWNRISVPDALKKQLERYPSLLGKAENFGNFLSGLKGLDSVAAIKYIYSNGYGEYLDNKSMDESKVELLRILAEQEPVQADFLKRLEQLPKIIEKQPTFNEESIILSTVHSSKGLEYDTVYIMDIYDGVFPKVSKDSINDSDRVMDNYQEERRLFYVAMTRAINKLYLLTIDNRKTTFADEIVPFRREGSSSNKITTQMSSDASVMVQEQEIGGCTEEIDWQWIFEKKMEVSIRQKQEAEVQKKQDRQIAEMADEYRYYNEIKDQFTQQEEWVVDSSGQRWIKCIECDCIKRIKHFDAYGGINGRNLGVCSECFKKR